MKIRTTFYLVIGLLLCFPSLAFAARLETRFGPILYDSTEQLREYGRCLYPFLPRALNFTDPTQEEIVSRHEYIFETICDRLGIRLNGQKTAVQLVDSVDELRAEYHRLVPDSRKTVKAFYSHQDKTIWYALNRLDHDVALHETAHAILDHYFFRPIPAGIDESVAEMVERTH